MNVTHKLTIDLLTRGVANLVHAVRCDANTRAVAVTLTAGGVAWEPPANTAISVAFKKPDGKKGWYDKLPDRSPACSVSGNVVTAILAPEVLTAAGKVDAVIVFQDKDLNQLATFGFAILVEPNPAAGRGISNDYYSYSTMEAVSDAVEAMLDSLEETKADIGQLIVQAGDAVSRAEQAAGPAIVSQASGEVIAVADSAERPVQGLKIFGKTVQNGTPSPDAPVELEIAGAGGSIGLTVVGKNLMPVTKAPINANGITWTVQEDGSVKVSGTATATTWLSTSIPYGGSGMATLAPGTYFLSGIKSGSGVAMYLGVKYSDGTGEGTPPRDTGNGALYTLNKECQAYIQMVVSSGTTVNTVVYPQLEMGTAATSYERYKAQSLTLPTPNGLPGMPVAYGGNYTDENGQQWLCDEVDLAGGVYVKWFATDILTGEEEWKEYANRPGAFNAPGTGIAYGGMCSHYPVRFEFADGTLNLNYTIANVIYDTRFAGNVDGLKAFFAEQYAAGTPVTVLRRLHADGGGGKETALTAEELAAYAALHTNKPNTTVFNDAGAHMELSYVADTKLYIDQKFTALENAILSAGANV